MKKIAMFAAFVSLCAYLSGPAAAQPNNSLGEVP